MRTVPGDDNDSEPGAPTVTLKQGESSVSYVYAVACLKNPTHGSGRQCAHYAQFSIIETVFTLTPGARDCTYVL